MPQRDVAVDEHGQAHESHADQLQRLDEVTRRWEALIDNPNVNLHDVEAAGHSLSFSLDEVERMHDSGQVRRAVRTRGRVLRSRGRVRARPRGAGRPPGRPRAQASRSSARSGDSPDDEPGEPADAGLSAKAAA